MAIIILPLLTRACVNAALETSASLYGTTREAIMSLRNAPKRNSNVTAAKNGTIKGLREMGYHHRLLAEKFTYRAASMLHLLGSRHPEDTDEELFAAIKVAVNTGRAVILRGNDDNRPARHGKYIFCPPTNKGRIPLPDPDRRVTGERLMQQLAKQQDRVRRIRKMEDDYLSGHYPNASSRGF